ncbi:MAG: substrate-binding domain-containing protein [Alistipes finegoldii]
MACDDNQAYHITEACLQIEGKFRIPNDIAILGVDNDETICKLSTPTFRRSIRASSRALRRGAPDRPADP